MLDITIGFIVGIIASAWVGSFLFSRHIEPVWFECKEIVEKNQANSRLNDAAPDLLAACKAFVEAWKKSHQLEKTDIALMMAEQAIEKAEGSK